MLNIGFIKKQQHISLEIVGVAIQQQLITNYFDSNIISLAPPPLHNYLSLFNVDEMDYLLLVGFIGLLRFYDL